MRSYYELTLRTESPSIFLDDLSRKDRSDSASRVPVSIKHGLRTTDCGLGIKHGQGIKRGLRTADWV